MIGLSACFNIVVGEGGLRGATAEFISEEAIETFCNIVANTYFCAVGKAIIGIMDIRLIGYCIGTRARKIHKRSLQALIGNTCVDGTIQGPRVIQIAGKSITWHQCKGMRTDFRLLSEALHISRHCIYTIAIAHAQLQRIAGIELVADSEIATDNIDASSEVGQELICSS